MNIFYRELFNSNEAEEDSCKSKSNHFVIGASIMDSAMIV